MQKIKYLIAVVIFSAILGFGSLRAQTSDSFSSASSSSTTTMTQPNNEGKNNPTALIIGIIGLVALAAIIGVMYKNRKNTIGGIQSQDKRSPEPATTQSIDNPGAGV